MAVSRLFLCLERPTRHQSQVQWLSAMVVSNGCQQWLSAMAVSNGCQQWLSAMAVSNGCQQWLSAMAVSNGCQQWLSAMAVNNGCQQWLFLLLFVFPPKTACFEGFGPNGRHHANQREKTIRMVKFPAQTELLSGKRRPPPVHRMLSFPRGCWGEMVQRAGQHPVPTGCWGLRDRPASWLRPRHGARAQRVRHSIG